MAHIWSTKCEEKRDFKLTVIVLTTDRPHSLARLLKSIANTDFVSDDDYFDIEIHVDYPKTVGLHYQECVNQARNFTMPDGRKGKVIPRIFEKNHGLRQAWYGAWYPKPDDEYCIIIEDDLEVSPFWYTWLKKAWLNYGNRTDIAGIALQRQFLMFKKPERSDMEIINNHEPFLYKLVGTWAFSPHPKNWRLFLDWVNSIEDLENGFDPYVPGLVTSDWLHMHKSMGKFSSTWEQHHVYWCEHHDQYTMYINLPGRYVLASNWREAGVHNRVSFNSKDYPTLDYCAIQLQEFPKELKKFGWDALEETDDHHWRDP